MPRAHVVHPPLADELRACGYADDPERFRELIMDTYAEMFREFPIDQFLCQVGDPAALVSAVRQRSGCDRLPHELVLRTLLNMRKKG